MDLKMPPGKMGAQVAHASVECVLRSSKPKVDAWVSEGMKKIVLKVADLKELQKYQQLAKAEKLVASMITDGAHTFFDKPTTTCLGIGPDTEEKIDKVTAQLKML